MPPHNGLRPVRQSSPRSPGRERKEALLAVARSAGLLKSAAVTPVSHAGQTARHLCATGDEVFVSYSSVSRDLVAGFVRDLRRHGVATVWDQDLPAGAEFRKQIPNIIDRCRCTVVVWCPHSVESRFVIGEVEHSIRNTVLLPVHVPGFEFSKIPIDFGHLNSVSIGDLPRILKSLAMHGVIRLA
jgi:TIR domain